jgi:hypothetical protein
LLFEKLLPRLCAEAANSAAILWESWEFPSIHSLTHFLLSLLLIFPNFEVGSDFALTRALLGFIFFEACVICAVMLVHRETKLLKQHIGACLSMVVLPIHRRPTNSMM